eukprot:jgi/Botrbrau1/15778/Bobra.4_1s0133.5
MWDEAVQQLSFLLKCPYCFDGEHFLQILNWIKAMTSISNAFLESADSRLEIMLEKEVWRQSTTVSPEECSSVLLSIDEETRSTGVSNTGAVPAKTFEELVRLGNPWSGKTSSPSKHIHLGFGGASAWEDRRQSASPEKRVLTGSPMPLKPYASLPVTPSMAAFISPVSRYPSPGSDGASTQAYSLISREDAPETFLDHIDEDGASQKGDVIGAVHAPSQLQKPGVTTSIMHFMACVRQYCHLLRHLPATSIWSGVGDLFDMLLLHMYTTFCHVSLTELFPTSGQATRADFVSTRLRSSLGRILHHSSSPLKDLVPVICKHQNVTPPPQDTDSNGADGEAASVVSRSALSFWGRNAASKAGSLWGFEERVICVTSLSFAASELRKCKAVFLQELGPHNHQVVETFYSRTVDATDDMTDCILRTGVEVDLSLKRVIGEIMAQDYDITDPPERQSAWVDEIIMRVSVFRQRLADMQNVTGPYLSQIWKQAVAYVAEAVLEGISSSRSRCTAVGRNAMYSDVQETLHSLKTMAPLQTAELAAMYEIQARLLGSYVKAYFIADTAELQHWILQHPEYAPEQLRRLALCVADSRRLGKKDRATFLSSIEQVIV